MKKIRMDMDDYFRSIKFDEPIFPYLKNTIQTIYTNVNGKDTILSKTYYDEIGFIYKLISNFENNKSHTILKYRNEKNQVRKIVEISEDFNKTIVENETIISKYKYDKKYRTILCETYNIKEPWEVGTSLEVYDKNNRCIHEEIKEKIDSEHCIINRAYDDKGRCIYYYNNIYKEENFSKTFVDDKCYVISLNEIEPLTWTEYYKDDVCYRVEYDGSGTVLQFEKSLDGKTYKKIIDGETVGIVPNKIRKKVIDIYSDEDNNKYGIFIINTQIENGIERDVTELKELEFDGDRISSYTMTDATGVEFETKYLYEPNTEKQTKLRIKKKKYLKLKKKNI